MIARAASAPPAPDAKGAVGPTGEGGKPAPPTPVGFDPADRTVDEVKAYVEANPGERDAVLDAELDGKNRVTLVTWLEEFA